MKNRKIELKWAVIFSLMTLAWMFLEKMTGLHGKYIDYHLYLTNLYAIPAIIVMVMALKAKKVKDFGGEMSYKQGFISGLILSLIITALSPLTQWIISYVITPEYFPNVIKRSVELGQYPGIEEAEAYFNYKNYAVQSSIAAMVMGILTTSIAMIFLKSPKS